VKTRVLLIVILLMTMAPGSASAATSDAEARFVALVNDLRADRGLPLLAVDRQLVGPSRDWATHMATTNELIHAPDLSVGVSADWAKLGENVGVGPQSQVEQLFAAFVASPTHLENLVDPQFRYIGVGVAYDGQGRLWTTHRFMAVQGATASTTSLVEAGPLSPPAVASALASLVGSGV
jgi:uncharacterized protein YkwD